MEQAKKQLDNTFEHRDKIIELKGELARIDSELDLDKSNEVVIEEAKEDELAITTPIVRIIHSDCDFIAEEDYTLPKIEECIQTFNNENATESFRYKIICNVNGEDYQFTGTKFLKDKTTLVEDIKQKIKEDKESLQGFEDEQERWLQKLDINYRETIMLPYINYHCTNHDEENKEKAGIQLKGIKENLVKHKKLVESAEEVLE